MISLSPTATKTPLPKVTSLKVYEFAFRMGSSEKSLSETTTDLEPTATKMLLPYAVEYK